jgi:hypothetical protein
VSDFGYQTQSSNFGWGSFDLKAFAIPELALSRLGVLNALFDL